MPDMPDPRFRRSVILMCVHDHGGALGIAIDEPMPRMGLHHLLSTFDIVPRDIADCAVLAGGPMEPQRGFVLHSRDWLADDSHPVADDIALTGSLEVLAAIADGSGPRDYLVALGYAGWAAGQLERELSAPGWYVAGADPKRLFRVSPEHRWTTAFELEGIDPVRIASSSGHA